VIDDEDVCVVAGAAISWERTLSVLQISHAGSITRPPGLLWFGLAGNLFNLRRPPTKHSNLPTMSEKVKEFAEVPQQFIKEGTQVRLLFRPR
jgi:hypothetical protein